MSRGAGVWLERMLYAALMIAALIAFNNRSLMSPNWLYPYLSGAAHLDSSLQWRYSETGYLEYRALSNAEQRRYDFASESDERLRDYSITYKGLVYIVWAAKTMMPWLSYIQATVVLQCLAHIGITLVVASFFRDFWARLLFVLGYGVNPIVVHMVTFPMYYFWQVIPAFVLLVGTRTVTVAPFRSHVVIALLYALLLLAYVTRPSLIVIIGLAAIVPVVRSRGRRRFAYATAAGLLAVAMVLAQRPAGPWHTMFVGWAAYPNADVRGLSDHTGYQYFRERTGIEIQTDLPDGTFHDPVVRPLYLETLRLKYIAIVRDHPGLFLRNALLNFAQSFSVGHWVEHYRFNLVSALFGLSVFLGLLLTRQRLVLAGVTAYAATYVWYFPPIVAYTFGAYLLLAFGIICGAQTFAAGRGRLAPAGVRTHGSRTA